MALDFSKEYSVVKNKALLEADIYFFKHLEEITEVCRTALYDACKEVKRMQEKGYPEIEYIEFTLLRTRLLEHDYSAPVMVYGSDWYADPEQAQAGVLDTGSIYSFYETMIQEAVRLSKKYRSQVPEANVEKCMCDSAAKYWNYVELACQRAVMGFSLGDLKFTQDFRIRCGEYMGYGGTLWRFTPDMEPEQMKKWIGKKEAEAYHHRDFHGRDFSGWDFSGLNLTGCDFRDCNLSEADFSSADLTGAWFCGSCLRGADLQDTWMPEALFDHCDLRETVFYGARSIGKADEEVWLRRSSQPVSFAHGDLRGADLTGSAIEDADFTDAVMTGALINESHLDYYLLDEKQRAEIVIDDADDDDGDTDDDGADDDVDDDDAD